MNKYVKFSWEGNQDSTEGVATFTVLEMPQSRVPFPTFKEAHDVYLRMEKIEQMAFEDGRTSIKNQIKTL